MKDYLFVHEGFVCESPKSCMRMTSKVGLIDKEKTVKALEMIDLRLKSELACQEEVVEEIYRQFIGYWKLMEEVCRQAVKKVESDFPEPSAEK